MRVLLASMAVMAAVGCSKPRDLSPEQARAEAREVFENRCATCHGEDGRGDGPAARALAVKPRDYTDSRWQQATSDEQIRTAIANGGPAIGKSNVMPANKDLDPRVIDALVRTVRSFGYQTPLTPSGATDNDARALPAAAPSVSGR
jgi:mono/diheme cytochrome c family protein